MHRIDELGNIDNLFVTGNPAIGQIATRMGAAWPNAVQEELCNVVEAADLTLEKGNNTQLAQAISALAAVGTAIPLKFWQTDPDQYTVLSQDAFDSDGKGQDLLYKYVFPASVFSAMFHELVVPCIGYDLQLIFPYRMHTSYAGDVQWILYYRVVTTNEESVEITDWSTWASIDDASVSFVDTPSATANQRNLISGVDLVIPASAITELYCTLQLALVRNGPGASDTHTGNAEVDDSILLVPVLPS